VLDSADVLEQSVDDEQNDEAEERHDTDDSAKPARVAVAVVTAAFLVPALV